MERRRENRYRLPIQATVYVTGLPACGGRLRDLSTGGAFVQVESSCLSVGQKIGVDLRRGGDAPESTPLAGVVVRKDGGGFALRFEQPCQGLDHWVQSEHLLQELAVVA